MYSALQFAIAKQFTERVIVQDAINHTANQKCCSKWFFSASSFSTLVRLVEKTLFSHSTKRRKINQMPMCARLQIVATNRKRSWISMGTVGSRDNLAADNSIIVAFERTVCREPGSAMCFTRCHLCVIYRSRLQEVSFNLWYCINILADKFLLYN